MPASTVRLPLAGFWADNADVVTAVLSIVLALVVATLLDRAFARRGHSFAEAVTRGQVTPVLDTRLRFIRRLIYASILLIGIAVAVSQFTGLSRPRESMLASGALAAAIIGFAARQTLANVVAGIMLAITQPLRVGDWVTFEEQYGVVEDVRLNYTVLRTPGDVRVVIPNERLAAGILRNDTLGSDRIALDVSVWLAPERRRRARARRARRGDRERRDGRRGHPGRRADRDRGRPGAAARARPAPGRAARAVPRTVAFRRAARGRRTRDRALLGETSAGLHSEVRAVMESAFAA